MHRPGMRAPRQRYEGDAVWIQRAPGFERLRFRDVEILQRGGQGGGRYGSVGKNTWTASGTLDGRRDGGGSETWDIVVLGLVLWYYGTCPRIIAAVAGLAVVGVGGTGYQVLRRISYIVPTWHSS